MDFFIHVAIIFNSDFRITPHFLCSNLHGEASAHSLSFLYLICLSFASSLKCHLHATKFQINISIPDFSWWINLNIQLLLITSLRCLTWLKLNMPQTELLTFALSPAVLTVSLILVNGCSIPLWLDQKSLVVFAYPFCQKILLALPFKI